MFANVRGSKFRSQRGRVGRFPVVLLSGLMLLATACVQSPTGPGILYMDVKGTLGAAGGTETSRKGEACASTILALFAFGDASLEAAKLDGNITQVTTVDHHSTNFIGFGKFCTVVYGS